ncbi:MAG: methionyl-tRNA formyltransferase [Usitatibacter sp.]
MRVVFAGTPPFAACALDALLDSGHEVALVLTQPDRPAGRGMRVAQSAVSAAAAARAIETLKPGSLKDSEARERLREARADVMVVAAYGILLPADVLAIPARGCINIHASLLPRWRGAAPIQRAILAGDLETGISIMQMDAGLDTGPVLLARPLAIPPRATAGTLTESLASLGAQAIVTALASLDSLEARPQQSSQATYAAKVAKPEARIDWSRSAVDVDRQVRAFNPSPGAEAVLNAEILKIWEAEPVEGSGRPGEVVRLDGELVVACGEGALALRSVQRAGGKRMAAKDFLRGVRLSRGEVLGSAG